MELKNDVALTGTLHSVDQYLNVKLTDVHVVDADRYPQLVRMGEGRKTGLYTPSEMSTPAPSERRIDHFPSDC